jgi:hypothetical protein
LVVIIRCSVATKSLRIGEEGGDAGERLLLLGIEDMEDGADQQRMAGLFPMVAAFERALGIDQDVGDVLDVAHLVGAAPDLEQGIVMGRGQIGRVEQQAVREARAPSGGQRPVLALDVMDDRRAGPGEQRRHDQTHALARPGRRKGHDMFGPIMAQIVLAPRPSMMPVAEEAGRGSRDLAQRAEP